jgi:hypothetical protein
VDERIDFQDLGTNSAAFLYLRPLDRGVALGWGIEADGDLDVVVSSEDARRLAQALLRAAGSPA